jgi:integrase
MKPTGRHRTNQLTAISIRRLGVGRHPDGEGLYLLVDEAGSRRWVLRTRVGYGDAARRRDIGLGSALTVTLAEAREHARALRKIARSGGDPLADRRKGNAPDFKTAAKQCHEHREGGWKNEKHRTQWLTTLETYAYPHIGSLRVNAIGTNEVLAVLQPIWTTKPETARRVRQRVGQVLDWCKAKGYRADTSPTREISRVLPAQKDAPKHHEALPYAGIPNFLKSLQATGAGDATKAALEFLILTATRTSETLAARWSEIDNANAIWTIPPERMKSGRAHSIPLPARALEILTERKAAHSGKREFIFESKPGKPLSNMALLMQMRRMRAPGVPHGFRSSFRDWCAERTSAPREVAEACLAHTVPDKVERAYRRTDFMEKRKQLMSDWAEFVATRGAP